MPRLAPPPPPPEPYASLIAEWARALRSEGKSTNTIRCYVDVAAKFYRWCAAPVAPPTAEDPEGWVATVPRFPVEPDEVTPAHVRAWIAYRLDTTSPGNANNNHRSLIPWFNWLLDEEEIATHPMAKLKPPAIPPQPVPVVPVDALKRVLATCCNRTLVDRRDEAVIRLIFETGARLSEVAGLDMDDLDLVTDTIRVMGKGGKARVVPFGPRTGKAIGRYLRMRARDPRAGQPWLWLGEGGHRGRLNANGLRLMLRRRGDLAGIRGELGRNFHAHLGRHYSAHHLKAAGVSDGDLMLLFGWSSAEMVRRYGASAATELAHATARRLSIGDQV